MADDTGFGVSKEERLKSVQSDVDNALMGALYYNSVFMEAVSNDFFKNDKNMPKKPNAKYLEYARKHAMEWIENFVKYIHTLDFAKYPDGTILPVSKDNRIFLFFAGTLNEGTVYARLQKSDIFASIKKHVVEKLRTMRDAVDVDVTEGESVASAINILNTSGCMPFVCYVTDTALGKLKTVIPGNVWAASLKETKQMRRTLHITKQEISNTNVNLGLKLEDDLKSIPDDIATYLADKKTYWQDASIRDLGVLTDDPKKVYSFMQNSSGDLRGKLAADKGDTFVVYLYIFNGTEKSTDGKPIPVGSGLILHLQGKTLNDIYDTTDWNKVVSMIRAQLLSISVDRNTNKTQWRGDSALEIGDSLDIFKDGQPLDPGDIAIAALQDVYIYTLMNINGTYQDPVFLYTFLTRNKKFSTKVINETRLIEDTYTAVVKTEFWQGQAMIDYGEDVALLATIKPGVPLTERLPSSLDPELPTIGYITLDGKDETDPDIVKTPNLLLVALRELMKFMEEKRIEYRDKKGQAIKVSKEKDRVIVKSVFDKIENIMDDFTKVIDGEFYLFFILEIHAKSVSGANTVLKVAIPILSWLKLIYADTLSSLVPKKGGGNGGSSGGGGGPSRSVPVPFDLKSGGSVGPIIALNPFSKKGPSSAPEKKSIPAPAPVKAPGAPQTKNSFQISSLVPVPINPFTKGSKIEKKQETPSVKKAEEPKANAPSFKKAEETKNFPKPQIQSTNLGFIAYNPFTKGKNQEPKKNEPLPEPKVKEESESESESETESEEEEELDLDLFEDFDDEQKKQAKKILRKGKKAKGEKKEPKKEPADDYMKLILPHIKPEQVSDIVYGSYDGNDKRLKRKFKDLVKYIGFPIPTRKVDILPKIKYASFSDETDIFEDYIGTIADLFNNTPRKIKANIGYALKSGKTDFLDFGTEIAEKFHPLNASLCHHLLFLKIQLFYISNHIAGITGTDKKNFMDHFEEIPFGWKLSVTKYGQFLKAVQQDDGYMKFHVNENEACYSVYPLVCFIMLLQLLSNSDGLEIIKNFLPMIPHLMFIESVTADLSKDPDRLYKTMEYYVSIIKVLRGEAIDEDVEIWKDAIKEIRRNRDQFLVLPEFTKLVEKGGVFGKVKDFFDLADMEVKLPKVKVITDDETNELLETAILLSFPRKNDKRSADMFDTIINVFFRERVDKNLKFELHIKPRTGAQDNILGFLMAEHVLNIKAKDTLHVSITKLEKFLGLPVNTLFHGDVLKLHSKNVLNLLMYHRGKSIVPKVDIPLIIADEMQPDEDSKNFWSTLRKSAADVAIARDAEDAWNGVTDKFAEFSAQRNKKTLKRLRKRWILKTLNEAIRDFRSDTFYLREKIDPPLAFGEQVYRDFEIEALRIFDGTYKASPEYAIEDKTISDTVKNILAARFSSPTEPSITTKTFLCWDLVYENKKNVLEIIRKLLVTSWDLMVTKINDADTSVSKKANEVSLTTSETKKDGKQRCEPLMEIIQDMRKLNQSAQKLRFDEYKTNMDRILTRLKNLLADLKRNESGITSEQAEELKETIGVISAVYLRKGDTSLPTNSEIDSLVRDWPEM